MMTIKRLVTILALIYLVVASLILFFPFVRSSTVGIFGVYSLPLEINLLLGFTWASVGVVGLLLVFTSINSGLLHRKLGKQDAQINSLKAQLYEVQKPLSPPPPPAELRATPSTYMPPSPPATY